MFLFKCKMCGADLEISEGLSIAECEYCGTKQTVPKAMDENLQNLFNRANTLRIKSEFDKAERLYEKIIQSDSTQSDAYWGLILCKYGIEYVDDPVTFKKVPTCHRASYDSIIADDDYKSAIENADMSQRLIYEEQAKEIDRIQKEILALAQKEESYDVFICYKETDASGHRTQDSVIANDIYYQLAQEGFKVFYAAITLEGKLGSAYEPIIFAALNSAKVMLAIGTKPEYFNAVWVKNEWSRYLKIIKNDRSKLLIPCYRDMDAYELPDEFAHLQAQDMAKIGFINDVVRGIQKVITKDEPKKVSEESTSYTPAPANTIPLLKRAFMFLEDGEWSKADDFCEQVLNQDPENAQAYLGKLMAELRVRTQEDLKNCAKPFDDKNNYKKVVRFGDESLTNALAGYIIYINDRNETARLDGIYNRATESMKKAQTEKEFKSAAELFDSIKEYKDSATLAKKCREDAETARKEAIISSAKECMQLYDYEEAIEKLEAIKDYEKADALIAECKSQIEIIKNEEEKNRKNRIYNKAVSLMNERTLMGYTDAIKEFAAIPGFKNANELSIDCQNKIESLKIKDEAERIEKERKAEIERIEKEKRKKKNILIASISSLLLCLIIVAIIYISRNTHYNKGLLYWESGNKVGACDYFSRAKGFKDSERYVEEYKSELKNQLINNRWYAGQIFIEDYIGGEDYIAYYSLIFADGVMMERHSAVREYGYEDDPIDWEYDIVFKHNSVYINVYWPWDKEFCKTLSVSFDSSKNIASIQETENFDKMRTLTYKKTEK